MSDPKVHKVRFVENDEGIGKYRKQHEVTVGEMTVAQMVVWVDTIVLDKLDIEFLMESEA